MFANEVISGKGGIYLRLSREDGDKVESDSIGSQRKLIANYIEKNKRLKFVKEYVDDGYSGTNFNRPGFQEMLEDAKAGKINCLIVKDLSRLGRNYIETGRYLEKIFPLIGLRVIAINDNYDSADNTSDENQIIVPFKNLINDAYCRDISLKIRSHFDVKRRNGQFIGSFASYGYMKDPKDKNHLIVDDYAAEIVELIFSMKLNGIGPANIAKKLDELGVKPPYEYKRKCGLNYNSGFRSEEGAKWPVESVIRILKNELYTGTLIQGKTRKINYKVDKSIPVDKANWIYVDSTHDAIVSKEKFDAVQSLMEKDTRTSPDYDAVYPLCGYVKCGDCNQNMVRRSSTKNGKKYFYYHCSTYKNGGQCTSHMINCQKVSDAVITAIRTQVELLDKAEKLLQLIENSPNTLICIKTLDKQLENLKAQLEYYGNLKAKLYKDMVDGVVTKEEFGDLNSRFSKSRSEVEASFREIEKKKEQILTGEVKLQPWIENLKKHRNITELSRTAVVSLIDRVIVHDSNCIEVVFLFSDEIAELAEYANSQNKVDRE